ncbi:putative hydroxymethylpyrimidine transporter CytX [Caenibacillus caldisaponilyticus]|uniref:putative hydroxymethylpyrimidine transporter CytX n=1 Tax=Caenibacillus caldisaponilyticus TaxID=1674942 RepID=UPI0009885649|nr:putative hydroxymethylpyrimidine transporter CytX [Caenibacillus caldisaponilyticus]
MSRLKDVHFFFLWFGAAVSISEILAGTLLAPLGFVQGFIAILLGHLIGTTLLAATGYIGTKRNVTAMGMTAAAFGPAGMKLFSILNFIQLLGWTAVMMKTGGEQLDLVANKMWAFHRPLLAILLVGLLTTIWTAFGKGGNGLVNTVAVGLLLVMTLFLFVAMIGDAAWTAASPKGHLSFGSGLELVVVMPLSWLPVIADYNRYGQSPRRSAVYSWFGYFIGSSWMYAIGLIMALALKTLDLGAYLVVADLGLLALGVILISTVTTTFLDVNSAAESFNAIVSGHRTKPAALAVGLLGLLLAVFFPLDQYENFLYMIGSLFAPLYAVVLTEALWRRPAAAGGRAADGRSGRVERLSKAGAFLAWLIGVGLYNLLLKLDLPLGSTIPTMILTGLLYVVFERMREKWQSKTEVPSYAGISER